VSLVVLGERPPEIQSWLERRKALGQDRFDEVWEGEYHVAPAARSGHGRVEDDIAHALRSRAEAIGLHGAGPVNIGHPNDYRVPDRCYLRSTASVVYEPTAALVVEIVSPGDETYRKFDFYFRHDVEELLIVDPDGRRVEWYARGSDGFVPADRSALLDLAAHQLHDEIDWPD